MPIQYRIVEWPLYSKQMKEFEGILIESLIETIKVIHSPYLQSMNLA